MHYSLRNSSIQAVISQQLSSSIEEAITLGLDSTKPANSILTPDEYEELKKDQKVIKEAKKKVFGTLKDALVKLYGKNVQSYILSNRVIQDLALGKAQLPRYRIELFRQLSTEYSLEIESYLD